MIPVILSYPFTEFVSQKTEGKIFLWVNIIVNLAFRSCLSTNIYTAVMVFINNSVPKLYLGRANGIGQTVSGLARGIGPTIAGSIFSISFQFQFFLHNSIVFIVIVFLALFILFVTKFYPKSIEKTFEERVKM